jgi:hypothetical protein
MRTLLITACVMGVLLSASWPAAAMSTEYRKDQGTHYTRSYMPWAAAPEQTRPSAPIPEPNGALLFMGGLMVAGLFIAWRGSI